MKIQKIPQLYMHGIKITPLIRFLVVLCIIVAGTAVNPQIVKADVKPGWIVSCTYSHSLNDDPIVFPGQAGVSHLHDFTGAKTTNALSTFTSLRAGGTTCAVPGDNSSYWVPALYEDGVRILPQAPSGNSVFYYRRIGAPAGTVVQPFPPGLRIIIGNAHAMSPQENPGLGTTIVFNCGPGEQGTPPLPVPPTECASGIMVLALTFPNCWDGVNLDSADHRSHMSYPVSSSCPASHPVNLPRLESFFRYIVGTGPIGTITLASGPYYTAHQDFFNAWHPAALQTLVTNCINAGIVCGTNPSLPPGILSSTISGNTGVGGVTLSYTDGTAKTVTSSGNGNYALPVSDNWSGSVTPSHACFTFSPTGQNYINVITNQTSQNYTPTFLPGFGCADINVSVGGANQGRFGLPTQESTRASFTGVNNGPVKIESTNAVPIMGAERLIYNINGVNTSFSEMMGLPNSQLDNIYWLPWYNNVDLDTQLRFGNVSGSPATVHVYIGGVEMTGSPFTLAPGASTRKSFAGINNGPVKIVSDSDVDIVAAERVIHKVNGVSTSFLEMMALPNSQMDNIYWLPWYNNVDLDTQLRFGNVSNSTATVHVYIGDSEMVGSPFTLLAGHSTRQSFAGINNGPVKIVSDQDIVAAERLIYKVNGINASFTEMMALPNSQLDTTYWLPWYNNVDLDTQLRFGNVSDTEASVHIYIGGAEMPGSPFTLAAGASTRKIFAGINNGPVKIESNVNIVVAERLIYKVNNIATSFSEMMGLPRSQLDTTYWLPWYNNVDLDTQLRFGVP